MAWRTNRLVGVLCVSVLAASCSSGSPSTPVAPTPVIPQITGQWTGTYTVTSCNEQGSAIGGGFCNALGRGGGHTFTPTQAAASVSGTLGIGGFNIPVSGNVDANGVVSLSGSGPVAQGFQLNLNRWQATIAGSSMSGTMTYTVQSVSAPLGSVTVTGTTSLAR